jgi:hypothetical protein
LINIIWLPASDINFLACRIKIYLHREKIIYGIVKSFFIVTISSYSQRDISNDLIITSTDISDLAIYQFTGNSGDPNP